MSAAAPGVNGGLQMPCAPGCEAGLARNGVRLEQLELVLVTHRHPDGREVLRRPPPRRGYVGGHLYLLVDAGRAVEVADDPGPRYARVRRSRSGTTERPRRPPTGRAR